MKIIFSIQHAILKVMFCYSMVVAGCTSLLSRHHLVPHKEGSAVVPCYDLCSFKIIETGLAPGTPCIYQCFFKWFKDLIRKPEDRKMKYPLHALVKYFKQVQKYFADLKLPPYIQHKCISSFIAYHVKDINALKPIGKYFVAPLHIAIEKGHLELAEWLLAYGADVNLPDSKGRTPLHGAAWSCNNEAVIFLVDRYGAALDIQDHKGDTAAHIPLLTFFYKTYLLRDSDVVQSIQDFLFARGACANIENHQGYTARDLQHEIDMGIGSCVLAVCSVGLGLCLV